MGNQPSLVLVEYLKATGTQTINTEYLPTYPYTTIIADVKFNSTKGGRFGQYADSSRFYFGISNGNYIVGNGSNADYNHSLGSHDLNRHIFKLDSTGLYIDGIVVSQIANDYNKNKSRITFSAFASFGEYNIYSFKIYENGTLVRDFHPALYNGRPCMWELCENKPYYNQGTGEFLYGEPI